MQMLKKHFGGLMPCPFICPKIFWDGPNVLCKTKIQLTYCVFSVFVKAQRLFGAALNVIYFLVWPKMFKQADRADFCLSKNLCISYKGGRFGLLK